MIEQLARDIIKSKDRHKIKAEIEWYLEGHYTKCRFIAILISCNLYKEEYYELLEKLTDRNLLLKLYKLIKNEN